MRIRSLGAAERRSHSSPEGPYAARVRIAVYTDYAYSRAGDEVYADRAFALFLAALADQAERMVVIGRLRPGDGERARYPLGAATSFVGLPYYDSLARPVGLVRAIAGSLRGFWSALDDVDTCWLLGPHPLALAFAVIAWLRRRKVVLGVRQDLIAYARSRHSGRPGFAAAAALLDYAYRCLARRCGVVVVGPALRRRYGHAARVLEIAVSLVRKGEVVAPDHALARDWGGELLLLSVGRIDAEKNPLMLAEILARLESEPDGRRWRLVICGEGPLAGRLERRLEELGVRDRAELLGYVRHGEAMDEVYRSAHALIHVSHTEGFPQVIVEALAAGLPVVATNVGGIGEAVGGAALLVPPGDADGAAAELRRIATEPAARRRLIEAGLAYARGHTLDTEVARVAMFLAS